MKKLLNYTTSIEPTKTLAEITTILVGHHAQAVTTVFDQGQPVGIKFTIAGGDANRAAAYHLPVRVDRVLDRLQRDAKKGIIPPRYASRVQAARVAWRNVKAWLQAQFALIDFGQVDQDEVFLPYQLQGEQTFFDLYLERKQAQLEGPR